MANEEALDHLTCLLRDSGDALIEMGFTCDASVELESGIRLWFRPGRSKSPLQIEDARAPKSYTSLASAKWRIRTLAAHRLADLLSAVRIQTVSDSITVDEAVRAAQSFLVRCRG